MIDPNAFLKKPDFWFQAAVVGAVVLLIGVLIGALTTLFAGDVNTISIRTDIFYKFSLIGAGLVTFCTVAWRGILATQQVDAQRLQLEKVSEQITATEESNLAALLQKGAELISDPEKGGQVGAGIATLQAVATSKAGKFSIEAVNLLADFVGEHYPTYPDHLTQAARDGLLDAAKLGRIGNRTLRLKGRHDVVWNPVYGVRTVIFAGGVIDLEDWQRQRQALRETVSQHPREVFLGVTVHRGELTADLSFSECSFRRTKVRVLETNFMSNHQFRQCDFSGAQIEAASLIDFALDAENWFDRNNPPTCPEPIDWDARFLNEEPQYRF